MTRTIKNKQYDETPVTCPAWMVSAANRMKTMLLAISEEMLLNPVDIMSNKCTKDISRARQIGYWILRQTTNLSYMQIANRFHRADHATILHGLTIVEKNRSTDLAFRTMTDAILTKVIGDWLPDKRETTFRKVPDKIEVARPSPDRTKSISVGGMLL